ncbi:hypothetical protein [Paenibacillus daejeonensis]|uniref:hypothetical protein n=1 Tax=Paenibacillus daejeonensis TaxID=135193 RepID=UPI0003A7C71D|nr:hypothetical protein [Paenibacillus daejeonensis]
MKRSLLVMMVFTFFLAFGGADIADAKRGGGFKSPKQSVTKTPKQSETRSDSGAAANTRNTSNTGTGAAAAKPGFFSGGSLMKGLMIGGLAGMLFGGMFGGLGFMGEMLGLLVNVFAIFLLIVAVRGIIHYFRNNRRRMDDQRRPY